MGEIFRQIKDGINFFWTWWCGELAGLVPEGLKRLVAPPEKSSRLYLAKTELHLRYTDEDGKEVHLKRDRSDDLASDIATLMAPAADMGAAGNVLRLELAPEMILTRQIKFPVSARNSYQKIITLQFERYFPLAEGQVLYDSVIEENNENSGLSVRVAIVRRKLIEEIREVLSARHITLKFVTSGGQGRGEKKEGGFSFLDLSGFLRPEDRKPVLYLSILFAALLPLWGGLYYYKLSQREDWLEGQTRQLAADVKRIEAINSKIFNEEQQRRLYGQKTGQVRFSEILAALTETIPRDSWVFELNKTGERLVISGKAPNSSKLVAMLDQVPLFEKVANETTVVLSGVDNNMERFSISLQLKPEIASGQPEGKQNGGSR